MPKTIDVEGVGPVEFPDDATQDEISEALNRQYPPPKVSGLRAAIQHAATGVGPGVAFTQAFPLGAAYGAGLTALIPGVGETGVAEAIGAGIGGLATGTTAAILASKAQRAGLRAIAPTFAQKLETELAAGEAQHPYLSAAGEVASLAPAAKMAPLALRTLPFRAALGAGVGAALPIVTEQRPPTAQDIAVTAAMGTIYGEPRINLGGRLAAIARAKTMLPRAAAQAEREVADAIKERVVTEDHLREYTTPSEGGLPERARPSGGYRVQPGAAVEPQVQAGVQSAEVSEAGRQRVLVGNRPAVKTMPDATGKFTYVEAERLPTGEWETHDQIIERAGLKTDQIDRRVFLDQQGHEKPREQTAQELAAVGEPSKMPGEAHSTDVNRLAQAPQTPLDAAIKEAEASASKVLDEYVAGVWPSEDQMTRVNASIEEVAKKYGIKPNELRRNVLWTVPKPPKEKAPLTGLEAFKQRTQELFGTPREQPPPAAAAPPSPPVEKPAAVTEPATKEPWRMTSEQRQKEGWIELWHGTTDEIPFKIFKKSDTDVGIHFGTREQAEQRVAAKVGKRFIRAYIKPRNILEVRDIFGTPSPEISVAKELRKKNVISESELNEFLSRSKIAMDVPLDMSRISIVQDRIREYPGYESILDYTIRDASGKTETASEGIGYGNLKEQTSKAESIRSMVQARLAERINREPLLRELESKIANAGYDTLAYRNAIEGKGGEHDYSFAVIDPSDIKIEPTLTTPEVVSEALAPSAALKPEAPKADVARLIQEDATKKVPEARETLDAHETVPTELAGKPASLGKWLTRTARPSEKAPETQTSRLTTLQSPDNQRVAVVSTYDHPRYGAMLFDPSGGTKHVALTTLLKQGWKPIASTLTKEPHSRFRKVFGSMEAYQSEVGQPLAQARAALKTYPAPTQVTEPVVPAAAETVTDPIVAHLAQHPTLNAAIAAIQTAPNRRQIQAAIRSAMDDLQQKNPKLTDEQAAEQVLNTFYEQSRRPRPAVEPGTAPTVGAAAPAEPTAEAPKAAIAEPTTESPHGVRLDVTTPAEHPLGPIDTGTTPTLSLWQNLSGELKEAAAGLSAFWRAFAMQALPKISAENRVAGEAGVRYDASRRVARAKGIEFAGKVTEGIEDRNLQERIRIGLLKFSGRFRPQNLALTFDQKFGTALVEDNLRSIRQGFRGEGNTEAADAVTTLIGARNSPFQTEAQYQAFLSDPQTQRVIQRHKQLWDEQKDPIYRKANDLDPDLELETRGAQTGARINLKAVLPGDTTRTAIGGTGRPSLIRQAVTRLRRDPFARQAKGTGQVYEGSYQEIMASGFEREYPVAAQHEFIKELVDSGLAQVTQQEFPKELTVRGERPKAYELKIRPWRNYWIQVPRSLAPEFENVMGLTPSWQVPGVRHLSDFLTSASVQGFAEGSTHVANLSTGILTGLGPTANPMLNALIKSAGRADILYQLPRILIRGFAKNQSEMLRLAEIGAAKEPYTGLLGWFINRIDRGVRLVSADTYREMAAKGWVEDTETGLREYVNQVGQYSKRLQPALIARLRETGIQPFATAAHTFNVMGLRTLGFGPAAKSPTWYGALALRADKAGGLMGFIVLTAALNKLLSGNASGPPGTQLGNVGWRDDQGKVKQFPLARLFGYERGPRITGLQSYVEARRLGLPEATALGSGVRAIGGTALSYVSGPMVQFATKAITGKRPGVPMVQEAKVVPPPSEDELQPFKTQAAANIAAALQQANPAIDASLMVLQGKELPEILRRQFSRYTPRPGMSEATIEAMPKIVHSKQMFDYASALAKEARKQPRSERNDFINKRLEEDDVTGKDRAEAMRLLKLKGVFRYE